VMHLVNADCVVSRPLAVVQALAQGKSSVVECGSDGQVKSLDVFLQKAGLYSSA
jgi:hypothetical protein